MYRLYHFLSEGDGRDAWAWIEVAAPLRYGQRLTVEESGDMIWIVLDDLSLPSDAACPIWHVQQFV